MTRIEISQSAEALSRAAAERFVRITTAAVRVRGRCAVALSGGSTPKSVYRVLAYEPYRSQVQWDRIEFFWGDERHVPPDHADSNYRMAFEALLSKVPIASAQVHRVPAEMTDAHKAAQAYEDEIRASVGGPDPIPRFDLVHLGVGVDGHIASLFSNTPALEERRRLCVANWVPKLGAHRITMTLPILNAARAIVFMVTGAEKAPIVGRVLRDPDSSPVLPAQMIQPVDGDVSWMLDRAAAGE